MNSMATTVSNELSSTHLYYYLVFVMIMGGLLVGKAALFNFAKEHLDKPEAFKNSILWTEVIEK